MSQYAVGARVVEHTVGNGEVKSASLFNGSFVRLVPLEVARARSVNPALMGCNFLLSMHVIISEGPPASHMRERCGRGRAKSITGINGRATRGGLFSLRCLFKWLLYIHIQMRKY